MERAKINLANGLHHLTVTPAAAMPEATQKAQPAGTTHKLKIADCVRVRWQAKYRRRYVRQRTDVNHASGDTQLRDRVSALVAIPWL
jgi:hypothetical protein